MSIFKGLPKIVIAACVLAGGAAGLTLSWAVGATNDVSEREIEMNALPDAVAATFNRELEGQPVTEVEEISYEGIVVLYEVEYDKDGERYEIYAYPTGEVAAHHSD